MMTSQEFSRKKIAVLGLGMSGYETAQLLCAAGSSVMVIDDAAGDEVRTRAEALEKKGVKVHLRPASYDVLADSDCAVISPGIAPKTALVRFIRAHKIPIFSEIEVAHVFCRSPHIVGVTGTNGKSTTVSLLGAILAEAKLCKNIAGNIGTAFAEIASCVDPKTWVVLELSSFQLHYNKTFSPAIACILNVAENHLDWHRDFEEYVRAKWNIFSFHSSQIKILNYDDPVLNARAHKLLGADRNMYFFGFDKSLPQGIVIKEKGQLYYKQGSSGRLLADFSDGAIFLKGRHNLYNIAAAWLISRLIGVPDELIEKVVRSFKGLEHRFEYVDTIERIAFINDSKSTTPHATVSVVKHLKNPIVLIAGGRNKGLDFSVVPRFLRAQVRHIVLVGEAKEEIKRACGTAIPTSYAGSIDEAVRAGFTRAKRLKKRNTYVVLSPMCTSFDMFKDFKERGRVFKHGVARLKEETYGRSACALPARKRGLK